MRILVAITSLCCLVGAALAPAGAMATEGEGRLAFVLLPEGRLPEPAAVVRAFPAFAGEGQRLSIASKHPDAVPKPARETQAFDLSPRGRVLVGLMSMPVPDREAENAARFSVSGLGRRWEPPPHPAHLVVFLSDVDGLSAGDILDTFTSALGAIAEASKASAVYWGSAGATHEAGFFIEVAKRQARGPRLMLWSGVSLARESKGRISLLSLGMGQLGLPDLLMLAPASDTRAALSTFYDLLAFAAERGSAPPEGDTVGRRPDERRSVTYVPSPLDPQREVWRVEFD